MKTLNLIGALMVVVCCIGLGISAMIREYTTVGFVFFFVALIAILMFIEMLKPEK